MALVHLAEVQLRRRRSSEAAEALDRAEAIAGVSAFSARGGSDVDTTTLLPDGWEALRGSYSPDGDHLVFLGNRTDPSSPDGRIVVVSGGTERDVTPEEATVDGYGWMPDSESLLISVSDDGGPGAPGG